MFERELERPSSIYGVLPMPPMRTRRSGRRNFRRNAIQDLPPMTDQQVRYRLDRLTATQRSWLEQDLERAAEVQRQLLPAQPMRAAGWEISYHYQALGAVGGDYCDVMPPGAGENELLLALGDASGKGIAASLMMARLHAIFHSLGSTRLPLPELVNRANGILCKHAAWSTYATLVCVRASSEGEIEVCNAGHCAPLVVSPEAITPLESGGFPLGMFPEAPCPVIRKRLARGESLFLYTDGVTEARNRCNGEYGAERLLQTVRESSGLAPRELIENCVESVARFQAGVSASDDVTIMAMRFD